MAGGSATNLLVWHFVLLAVHGLGYRSVVAYDGRVSEATLNQRTLAALFQWSPVPATVSDMATLDLVVTYGASVVETAIPA